MIHWGNHKHYFQSFSFCCLLYSTIFARYWWFKIMFSIGMLLQKFLWSSISLFSLYLSLSLRERESWHYNHSVPPPHHHQKLFKHLEVTYSQVWYIIGIVSSSPTDFHSEKIGLIRVTYDPSVSVRVNEYSKWLILKCDTSLELSAQALLISTQKK